ncbi:uncharacterized protein LOC122658382 [Telopea speciosissima]|uniref:uncharacterized protein LOC122658382 n=1 Tax=Telopea speciosissima TaxID=54955 RepID=UPI001CC38E42|nr:uncharacterized protein LOC122658382 [Telopea speciosissima]
MPSTITAVTLDSFLEPRNPGASKSIAKPPYSKLSRRHSLAGTGQKHLPQLSPALYATPEVTPVPDSPSSGSFPPSPYIINHKRRGPRLLKSVSQDDISLNQRATPTEGGSTTDENGRDAHCTVVGSTQIVQPPAIVTACCPNKEETSRNGFHDDPAIGNSGLDDNRLVRTEDLPKSVTFNLERDFEAEDFYDPQESMSFSSNNDADDSGGAERLSRLTTPMGEYYDAWDDLSSEGGLQASLRDMEAELREIRLNLLTEIERRKQAEETLNSMHKQWQRIREQLSLLGLTIPAASTIAAEDENSDLNHGEELLQQIYIAQMVSNSIARGTARAEVEIEMESQIESKNFEIARLCDRLHYYEAVNREMSQRNQEAVEVARRQRHRRKRMSRWVWSSIGTAVAVGAVALAWSFLPTGRESYHSMSSQAPDGDDATKA